VERVVASGLHRFEEASARTVAAGLGPGVCGRLQDLLDRPHVLAKLKSGTGHLGLDTLSKRLLLVLFALGTNMGIRQMAATGEHGHAEAGLRHVRQTYITRENLRAAIVSVVNATLDARDPKWWGKATSTASDSKRFASWDSNLMTEFHSATA